MIYGEDHLILRGGGGGGGAGTFGQDRLFIFITGSTGKGSMDLKALSATF